MDPLTHVDEDVEAGRIKHGAPLQMPFESCSQGRAPYLPGHGY